MPDAESLETEHSGSRGRGLWYGGEGDEGVGGGGFEREAGLMGEVCHVGGYLFTYVRYDDAVSESTDRFC
jgi:hypothetical protein